jgi:hypothetical protein
VIELREREDGQEREGRGAGVVQIWCGGRCPWGGSRLKSRSCGGVGLS